MSAEYELRPARQADFDFLLRLRQITMREYTEPIWGWDEAAQEKRFRAVFDPATRQVIVIHGRDAGAVCVERRENEHYLGQLYLLPEYQGSGIGTQIIESVICEAQDAGKPLTLHVLITNVRARRLYEHLGFVCLDETGPRLPMRWEVCARC